MWRCGTSEVLNRSPSSPGGRLGDTAIRGEGRLHAKAWTCERTGDVPEPQDAQAARLEGQTGRGRGPEEGSEAALSEPACPHLP